jgi:hypothetical protein
MKFHTCEPLCWHLCGKKLKKIIFSLSGVTDMNVAWNFVKEMKSNPDIDEIVWARHNQNGDVCDETLHLIKKNGEWLKNDIAGWSKIKNKI